MEMHSARKLYAAVIISPVPPTKMLLGEVHPLFIVDRPESLTA